MNMTTSQTQLHRSVKTAKSLPSTLPDTTAQKPSFVSEHPTAAGVRAQAQKPHHDQIIESLQSKKRPLNAASASYSLPAKRARLARTEAQTRKPSAILMRWNDSTKVLVVVESPRRSARLQIQQHFAKGERPRTSHSAPLAGAGCDSSSPARARLPRTHTQRSEVEAKEAEDNHKVCKTSFAQGSSVAHSLHDSLRLASAHPPQSLSTTSRNESKPPHPRDNRSDRSAATVTTTNNSQSGHG
jgi:hypothetical protein